MQQFLDALPLVNADSIFSIPQDVEYLVPEQGCWPFWLFKERNFQHDFFHRNRELITIINNLLKRKKLRRLELFQRINTGNFGVNHPLQLALLEDFRDARQLIKLALSLAESNKMLSFNKLFKRQSILLLEKWKAKLTALHVEILQQEIQYVVAIVKYLKDKNYQLHFITNDVVIDAQLVNEMYQLCADINVQIEKNNIDKQLVEEFFIAETFYKKILNGGTAFIALIKFYCEAGTQAAQNLKIASYTYDINQAIKFASAYLITENEKEAARKIQRIINSGLVLQHEIINIPNNIQILFKGYKNPELEVQKFVKLLIGKFCSS